MKLRMTGEVTRSPTDLTDEVTIYDTELMAAPHPPPHCDILRGFPSPRKPGRSPPRAGHHHVTLQHHLRSAQNLTEWGVGEHGLGERVKTHRGAGSAHARTPSRFRWALSPCTRAPAGAQFPPRRAGRARSGTSVAAGSEGPGDGVNAPSFNGLGPDRDEGA